MSQEKKTQETKKEQQAQMPLNRRQRRYMMKQNGMLQYLSKLSFFHPTKVAIRQQNMENGRKMQEARLDAIDKANHERLEAALNTKKESWANQGYNKAEIAKLEEAWVMTSVKDKENYQQDKKESRRLMREAKASMLSRTNK